MQGVEFIFSIIILIFSVVIHEVAHGYAADRLGDPTARLSGRLTINPIPHLELFGSFLIPIITYSLGGFILGWAKPVPYNPENLRNHRYGEALVALSGPAANIILAILIGLLIRFNHAINILPESFVAISGIVVLINIILAVFNLVPIPPLDGSKILFAILPKNLSHVRESLERHGFILVIIFIFFFWQLIYPAVPYLFSLLTGF